MPVLPSPPPSPLPPPKKWIAILCNFSQVMQWLQETLKTVLRQFWGGGIEGRHKQGLWQEIQKWWIVLFPSFIFFFVLFSWPYKLTDRYKSNKLMIFRVGNTWQSITSQELINLWPSTSKYPQERHFPDQWSKWKSKKRGTCITDYLPREENQPQWPWNLETKPHWFDASPCTTLLLSFCWLFTL